MSVWEDEGKWRKVKIRQLGFSDSSTITSSDADIISDNYVHVCVCCSSPYIDTVCCHGLVVVDSVLQLFHFLLWSVAQLYLNAETYVMPM